MTERHTGARLCEHTCESDEAVLGKVTVEGKGPRDVEPLHDREADGIGHREVLVVVLVDDLPRASLIRCSDTNDCRRAPLHVSKEGLTVLDTKSGEDERMPFNQDDVGRKLKSLLPGKCSEDTYRLVMVLIVTVQQGQIRR